MGVSFENVHTEKVRGMPPTDWLTFLSTFLSTDKSMGIRVTTKVPALIGPLGRVIPSFQSIVLTIGESMLLDSSFTFSSCISLTRIAFFVKKQGHFSRRLAMTSTRK